MSASLYFVNVSFVRYILSYEAVGIFVETSFPVRIRMREEKVGVQLFCDEFMFVKLGSIIGSDGEYMLFIR
jgi:hypothetical protein